MTEYSTSLSLSTSSYNGWPGFGPTQDKVLAVVALVGAVLSLVTCTAVVLLVVFIPSLRHFKSRLICYLAVFDMIPATDKLISLASPYPTSPLCKAMGYFDTVGCLLSIAWAMTIAIAMYIMIVHHIQPYEKKWFNDFTLLIATVIPIAIGAGLPPIHSGYGSEGAVWCWILGPNAFLYTYPLAWALICGTLVFYVLVGHYLVKKVRARRSRGEEFHLKHNYQWYSTIIRLAPFPLVVMAIWFFPTVHRVYRLVNDGDDLFALSLLHALTDPASGLINSVPSITAKFLHAKIVYGITYFSEIKTIIIARNCFSREQMTEAHMQLLTDDKAEYQPPSFIPEDINVETTESKDESTVANNTEMK